MPSKPEVSIIIPVLNEEDSIGNIINLIRSTNLESYEIIVVDGGSVDGTFEIVEDKNVDVVFQNKKGYINALFEGTKASKGDYIVWFDGDFTYNPKDIPVILNVLKKWDADHVIGSRFILKGFAPEWSTLVTETWYEPWRMPILHILHIRIINLLFLFLFRKPYTDTSSSFRAFKRAKFVEPEIKLNIYEDLIFYNAILEKRGYKIIEMPVNFYIRHGKYKLLPLRYTFKVILKLIFIWIFGFRKTKKRNKK